jgi:hypothetical protein
LQIALRESKFVQVQAFMERHLGRTDLSLSINCPFYGFGEPSSRGGFGIVSGLAGDQRDVQMRWSKNSKPWSAYPPDRDADLAPPYTLTRRFSSARKCP